LRLDRCGECVEFALKCSDEGCTVGASVAVGDDGHGEGAGVGQDRERDGYVSGGASERNHLGDGRAEKGDGDIRASKAGHETCDQVLTLDEPAQHAERGKKPECRGDQCG